MILRAENVLYLITEQIENTPAVFLQQRSPLFDYMKTFCFNRLQMECGNVSVCLQIASIPNSLKLQSLRTALL